jgi:rubredoxin
MKELLRCKPCGYVIREDKLGDVCPACGMPRKAFEPYREKVSSDRRTVLNLDMHPIAIHLSQTFVAIIPILIIINMAMPDFQPVLILSVLKFGIFLLPFSCFVAMCTGAIDGYTRFKTLFSPLLRYKIILSLTITALSTISLFSIYEGQYTKLTLVLSLLCLGCAVTLGLLGKRLLDVILPGSYPFRKKAGVVNPAQQPAATQEEKQN